MVYLIHDTYDSLDLSATLKLRPNSSIHYTNLLLLLLLLSLLKNYSLELCSFKIAGKDISEHWSLLANCRLRSTMGLTSSDTAYTSKQ